MSLLDFARQLNIRIEEIQVHGDPVLDNRHLPMEIRRIRKRVFDRARRGSVAVTGQQAQKKIEKFYRRSLWESQVGKELESEEPILPGHVRVMIPEIRTISSSPREYLLLVELAKSANTRNLIGTILTKDCNVEERVASLITKKAETDPALVRRLNQATLRFEKSLKKHGL